MIDKSKQYRTRDGREVRIYATDGGENANGVHNENGVHGAIKWAWGWGHAVWLPNGSYLSELGDRRDLIEVKPRIKREVWVNVYPMCQTIWPSEEAANEGCTDYRIACVKLTIDVEEGEGL